MTLLPKLIKKYSIIGLSGLLVLILLVGLGLTVIDLAFPNKVTRLHLWLALGLPRNEKILSSLSKPKAQTFTEYISDSIYWFRKDQTTYDPKKGFWCAIDGDLVGKTDSFWKVKTPNGQEFILELSYLFLNFYSRKLNYFDTTKEWKEEFEAADKRIFEKGDIVRVNWTCPVTDPKKMLEKGTIVKEEFLEVVPEKISKQVS